MHVKCFEYKETLFAKDTNDYLSSFFDMLTLCSMGICFNSYPTANG